MTARVESITIAPHTQGMEAFACDPGDLVYDASAEPTAEQQRSDCRTIFARSGAAARDTSDRPVPESVEDAYWVEVIVRWQVSYGPERGNQQPLGDGFDMIVNQQIQVRESQGLNVPPVVLS